MARILYGVAGEGSGHSSRAKETINHLLKQGHTVKVLSYDRGYANLAAFYDVEKIFGFGFAYRKNKIWRLGTVFKNLIGIPSFVSDVFRVLKIIKDFKPQIIFSDFEPISAVASHIKGIPLISIDNQHRLTNTSIEYPKKYFFDVLMAKIVTYLFVWGADKYLIISFTHDRDKIIKEKTFVFPPILRNDVLRLKSKEGDYILVYATSQFDDLIDVLRKIDKKFVIYGFNKEVIDGNLVFKKFDSKGFLDDLSGCLAVVANAGFTLITEAFYLKKPYLALPVAGQFEQVFNGYHLEKLGYGKSCDKLTEDQIGQFLNSLDVYKKNILGYKSEDNSKIFAKIDEIVKEKIK